MRRQLLGALALGTVALIGCGSDDDVDTPSDDSVVITDDSVMTDDSMTDDSMTDDSMMTDTTMP
jgi:uncharacterized protein YcfL